MGSLSRQSRVIDPHVEIRRGEGAQIKLCWETRCSSRVRPLCQGTFWVASRLSSTVSNFKRDLGVTLKVHPRSQASSRVEAKNSDLLFSSNGYLLEPIEWPKRSQASCGVLKEDSVLLYRPCWRRRVSSRDDRRISLCFSNWSGRVGFLLSYNGELMWPQGSPVSIRVARGSAALLSSHGRGIVP